MSSCADVIMWERNDNRRPQCTNECREAMTAMEGSRYGRMQRCCDCEHNDMSPMERRLCQQHHRNFEDICGMRRDVSTYYECFNPLTHISQKNWLAFGFMKMHGLYKSLREH